MNDNLRKAWEIIRSVQDNADLEDSVVDQMVHHTALGWTEHPHSAMEALSGLAQVFHLRNSKRMVSSIVQQWKQSPDYNWRAGGGADHCFLLGLLASGNAELAAADHLAECFPEYFLADECMRHRVTDYEAKHALVVGARPNKQPIEGTIVRIEDLDNSGSSESKPQIANVSLAHGEDAKDLNVYERYAKKAYGTQLGDGGNRTIGGYVTLADCNLEREVSQRGSTDQETSIRFRNAAALHLETAIAENSIAALLNDGTISVESLAIGRSE